MATLPVELAAIPVWRGSRSGADPVHGSDHGLSPLTMTAFTYRMPQVCAWGVWLKTAQSALDVSYNSVADYSRSMRIGLTESYPDYAAIRHEEDQQHPQLNDAVLH